ncbi:MAG: hypothetical protein J7L45_01770, partial [Candidatus Aenigmarchaeota archaeon]|nr:hypothetical protein [Candidatus Aenigmarchaeota archaeon]
MGLSDFIILASIITGLTSIPFLTSSITSDYTPTGNIIFDIGNSSTPSQLSRSLTSDKFQEVYQTPFGKLKIIVEPDKI